MASPTSADIESEMAKLVDSSGDGYTALQIFGAKRSCYAYTYDDVIVMPGHNDIGSTDVTLETNISRNIRVKIPLLSSPMDTVTEHDMAV